MRLGWLIFVFFALVMGGCQATQPRGWAELQEGSGESLIRLGRLSPSPRKISEPSPYKETIQWTRQQLEQDPTLINQLVTHVFSDDSIEIKDLPFRYRYASATEGEHIRLVLRYFGAFRHPQIWAGYSCQFVLDPESRDLIEVWVDKVPLE